MRALLRFGVALAAAALSACAGSGDDAPPPPPELLEARARLEARRPDEAFRLLADLTERSPDLAEAHRLLAEAARDLGRRRRAALAIERAIELDPGDARSWWIKALVERERFRPLDAVEAAERAVAADSSNADYRVLLGDLLPADPERAAAAYAAARALDPSRLDAAGGLARALVTLGRPEEARPLLDEVLAARPNDGELLAQRGLVRMRARDLEGAEEDFRRAIRAAPHLTAPYHNLAAILAMTGRPDESEAMRERHVEARELDLEIRAATKRHYDDPNDEDAALDLARLLERAGRTAEARGVRARAGRRRPDSGD